MEMVKTYGFCEISNDDLSNVQGGLGPIFWTCVGVAAGMVADGVIISTTGKSGGEWVATGIKSGIKLFKSWF